MRTLLLKPCWAYPIDRGDSTYNRNWPPLSLLNCAAILRNHGIETSLIDASAERLSPEEIIHRSSGYDAIFVTSASLDRWQCPNLELTAFIKTVFSLKKLVPKLYIIGTHGTVRPREILDITGVTAVIIGEPEQTVLDLCQEQDLSLIPGLAFYKDSKYVMTEKRNDADITSFPLPAYDLIDINRYNYEVLGSRFALLEASRGCPFHCIFCVKSMYGENFRVKTPQQFIKEIDYLIDIINVENIYFIDLEFTVNKQLVEKVCHHLIDRGVPVSWCCQTRADSVSFPLLKLMKSAGCKIVHFGIETGSERIRQTLEKGITFDQIETGMRDARMAGLQTVCFFMFGLPGETQDDMEKTIAFAKHLNPTYASFHIALPYPETEFNTRISDELGGELFPKAYTGLVPYETLEKLTRRAFWSYYLRPKYIAGRLKDGDFSTFFKQAKFFLLYLKHRLGS